MAFDDPCNKDSISPTLVSTAETILLYSTILSYIYLKYVYTASVYVYLQFNQVYVKLAHVPYVNYEFLDLS